MKFRAKGWALILLSVFFLGPVCDWKPGECDDACRVLKAIHDLENRDYVVVRGAINDLSGLLDAPNIWMAFYPVKDVLTNKPGFHDAYSQGMSASLLIRIGLRLGGRWEDRALDGVINELESANFDFVRASCAYALGSCGNEEAVEPLINANENDPSTLVQSTACEALMMLTSGRYYSEFCQYGSEEEEGSELMVRSSPENLLWAAGVTPGDSVDPEARNWIRTHVMLPASVLDSLHAQSSE